MRYITTTLRKPTRRGVMWLGQTCNLRCYFCYFANRISNKNHPEHPFFSIEKAKEICKVQREIFNLNSIDIQGGEPTIYPKIFELLDYCNSIGLKPTLITNGLRLSDHKFASALKDYGVYDLLVSLQGYESQYNKVVGVKGAFRRHIKGIENAFEIGIPLRANLVLTLDILENLEKIVRHIIEPFNFTIINFLGFNDWGDQIKNYQRSYDIIVNKLLPLIDYLEGQGREVNIRFLPFCKFPEKYRKNIQNSIQKAYDVHEWEKTLRLWIDRSSQRRAAEITEKVDIKKFFFHLLFGRKKLFEGFKYFKNMAIMTCSKKVQYKSEYDYLLSINKMIDWYSPIFLFNKNLTKVEHFYMELSMLSNLNKKPKSCQECDLYFICDGFHKSVLKFDSPKPVKVGYKVKDPNFYSKSQVKLIESAEKDWYFKKDLFKI